MQFDLVGYYYTVPRKDDSDKTNGDPRVLTTQADVTQYLLDQAGLAIVPFSAFGATAATSLSWYRLSVGTLDAMRIPDLLQALRLALEQLERPVGTT